MRQLSGLDAFFLNIESNATPMHVGGLSILEPPAGEPPQQSYARLRGHVEARLAHIPPMRRRLVEAPLGLDHPYWIEDPDFDLVHHIKRRGLPQPGDEETLADLVCELASARLDRNLPLWELHFVEGLRGGRVAAITKMHHAAIDGISGAEILGQLLDVTPTPAARPEPPAWSSEEVPSLPTLARLTARSLVGRPGKLVSVLRRSLPAVKDAGREALQRLAARAPDTVGTLGMAPPSRFNAQVRARRSYAFGTLPLAAIKAIKSAFHTTVNDVVLALCGAALRAYLQEKRDLPLRSLIAGVPLSTRGADERGTQGNQVMFTRASLHTDEPDPLERLHKINREMGGVKARYNAMPANLMGDWAELAAPALMARAARLYEIFDVQDRHAPWFNLVISNVPGPRFPLYFAGMRLLTNHPISIPFQGNGLNITFMSYCGGIDYGLIADHDTVPDIARLDELLRAALDELIGHVHVEPSPPAATV